MLKTLISLILAATVVGAVLGFAGVMIVFLGQDWADALFFVLAALLLVSGLLVVTMRDIIRCGLAMIVCFGALAGIYVLIGTPLLGAAQVIVYIGAISVLILFAIMLTQTKDAPSRLVFQTQAGPAAIAAVIIGVLIALCRQRDGLGRGRADRVHQGTKDISHDRSSGLRAALRDRERPAARRGHRRHLPREARAGRPVVSNSLDAYLALAGILFAIGSFGFLARRNAISMLMSIELMLNAVNLAIVAFGAFIPALEGAGRGRSRLMVMAVAAAEATVGLAIVIAIYRNKKTPLVDEYDAMSR